MGQDANELKSAALHIAWDNGHNMELRRDKEGHYIPLFRYRATGKCTKCGAELVMDTSPAQVKQSIPWGEYANAEPQIRGEAVDKTCEEVRRAKPKGWQRK